MHADSQPGYVLHVRAGNLPVNVQNGARLGSATWQQVGFICGYRDGQVVL